MWEGLRGSPRLTTSPCSTAGLGAAGRGLATTPSLGPCPPDCCRSSEQGCEGTNAPVPAWLLPPGRAAPISHLRGPQEWCSLSPSLGCSWPRVEPRSPASFPSPPAPCAGRGQEQGLGAHSLGAAAQGSLCQLLPRPGWFGVMPLVGCTHGARALFLRVDARVGLAAAVQDGPLASAPLCHPQLQGPVVPGDWGALPGAILLCWGGEDPRRGVQGGARGLRRAQLGWPCPIPLSCPCLQCPASPESCVRTTLAAGHVFPFSPNSNDSRLRAAALVRGHQPAPRASPGPAPAI